MKQTVNAVVLAVTTDHALYILDAMPASVWLDLAETV
jgi:hypothetical protein